MSDVHRHARQGSGNTAAVSPTRWPTIAQGQGGPERIILRTKIDELTSAVKQLRAQLAAW
jgi:hypothetical protein